MPSTSSARPQRLLRISKACDFCHKRRIKCQDSPGEGVSRCRNCAEFNIPCTYVRPSRRGRSSPQPSCTYSSSASAATGPGPGSLSLHGLRSGDPITKISIRHPSFPTSHITPLLPPHNSYYSTASVSPTTKYIISGEHTTHTEDGVHIGKQHLSATLEAFARTATPTIKRLATVFNETVFPIFPFFDPVLLQRRLDLLDHVSNRSFFCSVMAACALASARVRDGALSSANGGTSGNGTPVVSSAVSANSSSAGAAAINMPPEMFYAAAEEALPKDMMQCRDFNYLRALALLSIASIQDAKIAVMQKHIGHYFTLLAIFQWHDEANWSPHLRGIEIEERRRTYWSTYTLDVFSSIIWNGCIHFQESHAKVKYPTGMTKLDQERLEQWQLQQQQNVGPPLSSSPPSWMIGWNFTTDLYRILEHNLNKLRSKSSRFNLSGETMTPRSFRVSSQDRVNELYSSLPAVFKKIEPATSDPAHDIFGFQAANIKATMALLEMVHLSLEAEVDLERKCYVVHNVLQTFHNVPWAYMRAISAPLIYHIGGIGVILGSVMEGPLTENTYRLVRDLLLSMAALLESLETFLHRSAGTGRRLRSLATRLEGYYLNMRSQTQEGSSDSGKDRNSSISSNMSSSNSSSDLLTPSRTSDTAMCPKIEHSPPTSKTSKTSEQSLAQCSNTGNYRPAAGGPVAASLDANGSVQIGSNENSGDRLASFSQQQQQQQQHSHQHVYHQQQQLPPHQPHHTNALHLQEQSGQIAFASVSNPQSLPPAVADSPFDPRSQLPPHVAHLQHTGGASNGGPPFTHVPPSPGVPITGSGAPDVPGGPAPWVTSATGPGLTSDTEMQFHLPDEFLQDWTWPFAVSNNYLSY